MAKDSAPGGFEIGTQIIHMSQPHRRRFGQFLKQLKAGEVAQPRSARRLGPRPTAPKTRGEDTPDAFDDTLPLIPIA